MRCGIGGDPFDGERCVDGCWRTILDLCFGVFPDAGHDAASDAPDARLEVDAAADTDGAVRTDAGTDAPAVDAGTDAPIVDAGADAGVPATMTYCVDVFVSNTCAMSVSPTEITIPRDQTAYFCWHNRSADYPIDVWLSYGGGYTDLAPGATWNEPPGHCLGPLAHDEYADISTACSSHRFLIHCL